MKRKWITYNANGVRNDYVLYVQPCGMPITGYVTEVVGEYREWEVVHYMGGRNRRDFYMKGKAKTLADAKAKAEAAMERLVDKAIKDLQKWRGK